MDKIIDGLYLKNNPNHIFVFGDNTIGKGYGGGARFRDHPQAYGFITKKFPNNEDVAFYTPKEYNTVYQEELKFLIGHIEDNPNLIFLISKLGAGLANKYRIFELVIAPNIKTDLANFPNVEFLW